MPALDLIHDAVTNALTKDGWTITADPYTIVYEGLTMFADLAADRPIAAERGDNKIVVEIKSFLNRSPIEDFKNALGQYEMYRDFLQLTASERKLFLAISARVYVNLFQQKAIQVIVQLHQLSLLVVNIEAERIEQWIS
jgi:hypothetical protein